MGGGHKGPDGSREGRVSGRKEDRFPPTSQQRSWLWSPGGAREARGLQPALEGSGA